MRNNTRRAKRSTLSLPKLLRSEVSLLNHCTKRLLGLCIDNTDTHTRLSNSPSGRFNFHSKHHSVRGAMLMNYVANLMLSLAPSNSTKKLLPTSDPVSHDDLPPSPSRFAPMSRSNASPMPVSKLSNVPLLPVKPSLPQKCLSKLGWSPLRFTL